MGLTVDIIIQHILSRLNIIFHLQSLLHVEMQASIDREKQNAAKEKIHKERCELKTSQTKAVMPLKAQPV